MNGWIKLHRKMKDWGWWASPNHRVLFTELLIRATHKHSIWRNVQLEPGQLVTGRKQLAKWTGLSEQQVRTALNDLKSTNEITTISTSRFSIITIINWDTYQGDADNKQPSKQPALQPTDNQQITTFKNVKNVKKVNNNKKPKQEAMQKELIPEKDVFMSQVLSKWNEMAQQNHLRTIRKMTPERTAKFNKAIKVIPDLSDWKKLIDQVPRDKFRMGGGNTGWTANFDWLFRNENYIKILEEAENYDRVMNANWDDE